MSSFLYFQIFLTFLCFSGTIGDEEPVRRTNIPIALHNSSKPSMWTRIPVGYEITPGIGALKINQRRVSWNQARNLCIQEGAHLAVINSTAEARIIVQMAYELGVFGNIWIGIHDIFEENDWATIHDQPLSNVGWLKWAAGQPDNYYPGQNCGSLTARGVYDDSCRILFPFVCKILLPDSL
ncbi:hemolymph lipopolysaccharide-binding protein-like [Chelonus insularis]|uniref:hemolymph lipopolysaccharide-binding protein-like n=1 Tax=Chelonus insularis TaxID=460826 RepID=UPI00158E09DA|nr:hemolymph lipopolysaccharide-binding protein-like [Chelonus insularis]